jgi:hypothetical protein
MTERNVEIGPIVAMSMIAIGLCTVIWAVATNPHRSGPPSVDVNRLEIDTGTAAEDLAAETGGISDTEWEATLIDVERIKTDGLVTDLNTSTHVATVAGDEWSALSEDRRREIGRHLAIYCGRLSDSEEYTVEIVDQNGLKLGSYQRD